VQPTVACNDWLAHTLLLGAAKASGHTCTYFYLAAEPHNTSLHTCTYLYSGRAVLALSFDGPGVKLQAKPRNINIVAVAVIIIILIMFVSLLEFGLRQTKNNLKRSKTMQLRDE